MIFVTTKRSQQSEASKAKSAKMYKIAQKIFTAIVVTRRWLGWDKEESKDVMVSPAPAEAKTHRYWDKYLLFKLAVVRSMNETMVSREWIWNTFDFRVDYGKLHRYYLSFSLSLERPSYTNFVDENFTLFATCYERKSGRSYVDNQCVTMMSGFWEGKIRNLTSTYCFFQLRRKSDSTQDFLLRWSRFGKNLRKEVEDIFSRNIVLARQAFAASECRLPKELGDIVFSYCLEDFDFMNTGHPAL